ncbi:MAG: type IV pilus assembly protein PilM [Patescibacteria group bacterium]
MNNIFKDIFSKLGSLKPADTGSALGIDIGSSAIKIVELKKKGGKIVLETYGAISLGPYANTDLGRVTNLPVDKVVEALKEVLKQSSVSTTSSAFSIPVQSSLIFTLALPPQVKEGDIASVVSIEARKYIPLPITEFTLYYFMLPKREMSFEEANATVLPDASQEKKEVLAVAIQNEAISRYRSIVSECGLEASFFEIEVFSYIRSNFEHELSLVLVMDLGASSTKLTLVEFGMVKGHHTINRGGAEISNSIAQSLGIPFPQAEEMKKEYGLFENPLKQNIADIIKVHTDYIFSEANSVLLGYEKKYDRTVTKVILTGGGSLMKGFKEIAINNFRAELEIGQPFSKTNAPEFLNKVLESIGPEFAVSIGLALRKLQ